jgi:hypothetical protein
MAKIEIDREWCLNAAKHEGDQEVGAGFELYSLFHCPRCGAPLSQDPETERKAREAGMCALCVEATKAE